MHLQKSHAGTIKRELLFNMLKAAYEGFSTNEYQHVCGKR